MRYVTGKFTPVWSTHTKSSEDEEQKLESRAPTVQMAVKGATGTFCSKTEKYIEKKKII